MLFYCESCLSGSYSPMKSYSDWTDHLLSANHQAITKTAILSWSDEQNQKTWIVLSSKSGLLLDNSLTLDTILAHFSDFGFVADVFLEEEAKFAAVQLDFPEVLKSKLPHLQPGDHSIKDINVIIQRRMDITSQNWLSIIGAVNFSNRDLKEFNSYGQSISKFTVTREIREINKEKRSDKDYVPLSLPSHNKKFQIMKGKNKNIDDYIVSNSLLTSTSASITPFIPDIHVAQSLTFYNKNVQPMDINSTGIRVENQTRRNKNENIQGRDQSKYVSDKGRINGNEGIQNAFVIVSQNRQLTSTTSIAPNPVQKIPKFNVYYNLFLDLLQTPIHGRSKKSVKEFQELSIDYQLEYFMSNITMTHGDLVKRTQLLQELAELLRKSFPQCKLYPFGSMSSGLGDHFSDIDIYVDVFGETTEIHANPYVGRRPTKQDIMMDIKKLLRTAKSPNNRAIYGKIIPVLSARVPILKFLHIFYKINVDLSFENLLSFQNTKMISFIMTLDERVKPLLLLVRYWGKFHDLTGSTLIKNYAFILLVLVFLSKKKVIPTVYYLQSLLQTSYCIDGWNAGFCENRQFVLSLFPKVSCEICPETGLPTTRSILILAQEFFDTYAHTDFSSNVICSLTSELIPKQNFSPGNEEVLPQTLERYKIWSSRQSVGHRLNINTPFILQDPFLLSFNVGGVTTEGTLLKFQVACAQTAAILRENLKSIVEIFVPLPKQVGEKKFMSLQRTHTRHENLKREMKEALGYKNATFAVNHTETVPIHLLPIEKIISKKTIQYGQGWETYLHYSLGDGSCKAFRDLFNFELKCLIDNDLIRQVDLENKMKTLWITFVNEFLVEVWVSCFGAVYALEQVVTPMRRFSEFGNGGRPGRRRLQSVNAEPEVNDNGMEVIDQGEVDSQEFPSTENDELRAPREYNLDKTVLLDKLNCITDREYCISYSRFQCTADTQFWTKREYYRKQALKQLSVVEVERDDLLPSSNAIKKARGRASKRRRDKQPLNKQMIDPFSVERKVMKLILEGEDVAQDPDSTNTKSTTNKNVFQCLCWVKLDSSCLDDWPEVFLVLEKNNTGSTQNYVAGGTAVATTIKKVFSEFMFYKLVQWFAVEGLSDTESTKMEACISQSDITFTFSDSDAEDKNEADTEENDNKKMAPVINFLDSFAED